MDKDAVEITTVKLQLGKREIELTITQAKKLKAALDEMFGKEIVREIHHGWWYWPTTYTYSTAKTPEISWTVEAQSGSDSCNAASMTITCGE